MTAHSLVDRFLPDFEHTIVEEIDVDSSADVVYEAVRSMDFLSIRVPVVTALMALRDAPARLRRRRTGEPEPPAPATMRLADLLDGAPDAPTEWVGLGEDPPREVVFGAVGVVWKPRIVWREVPADEYAAFAEPGYAKIAAAFTVTPAGDETRRCRLTYEARTATTDEDSGRRFGRYWRLVRPFVGVIMRAALRRAAELAGESKGG